MPSKIWRRTGAADVTRVVVAILVWATLCGPGHAQTPGPRPGSLRVTVRDATDLPIAGAQFTLARPDGSILSAATDERGQVVFEGLPPAPYTARVEAPGFESLDVPGLTVRSGARVNREVVLEIAHLAEEIDVTQSDADRQLTEAFTEQLSAEQLAALPDDPDELQELLRQLVGADADIRVNGFSGDGLPRGAQIQEVRVRWDAVSADGSSGGGPRVDIRTQPGSDRWRSNADLSLRDEGLNARNAFSGRRPSGQTRQYSWTLNGPLVRNRTGVSLSVDRSDTFEQQPILGRRPEGTFSDLIPQPTRRTGFAFEVEQAINPAHQLRVELRQNANDATNLGIGGFDLPQRAYSREQSDGRLRVGLNGTFSRRYVNELRVQLGWRSTESRSVSDITTIRVLDAFTSGGAQVQGGRRSREFEIEDELELTLRRQHQVSVGVTINGAIYRGDEQRNASGTYTFPSLETFEAGLPSGFTQRIGDPTFEYSLYRLGWNVQDNYRINRSLMLNLGLRHDVQTHLQDWVSFSPRLGMNWTPIPGRKTTVRASFGVFRQSFEASQYEQTLLVNGQRQRDLVIANPGYPDPFSDGLLQAARPPSIVRAHPDLVAPSTRRLSIGVDQSLAAGTRLRATYSRQIGRNRFRSRDVNAPVDGARPDPSARNITQLESTGRSFNHSLELDFSLNDQARRLSGSIRYTLGRAMNDSDGAFTLPPDSVDLPEEWGPSRQDIRHRLVASINRNLWAGFRISTNLRAQSASPYTVTTGYDANGDGTNSERPAGVGRNSARGVATTNLDATLTWGRGFGRRAPGGRTPDEPRRGNPRGNSGRGGRGAGANGDDVAHFEIFVRATNVLNTVNPQNFSGVLTSSFFGQPTSAAAARRLMLGARMSF